MLFRSGFQLVVIHDELETALGQLKVRRGESSARGHNGIKSVQASLKGPGILDQLGSNRFVKIGVGIGRPRSRERDEVSAFVLGQVTRNERDVIEGKWQEVVKSLEIELDTIGT